MAGLDELVDRHRRRRQMLSTPAERKRQLRRAGWRKFRLGRRARLCRAAGARCASIAASTSSAVSVSVADLGAAAARVERRGWHCEDFAALLPRRVMSEPERNAAARRAAGGDAGRDRALGAALPPAQPPPRPQACTPNVVPEMMRWPGVARAHHRDRRPAQQRRLAAGRQRRRVLDRRRG